MAKNTMNDPKPSPTRRASASGPNIQNIPVRTETGRLVREAFLRSTGHG